MSADIGERRRPFFPAVVIAVRWPRSCVPAFTGSSSDFPTRKKLLRSLKCAVFERHTQEVKPRPKPFQLLLLVHAVDNNKGQLR